MSLDALAPDQRAVVQLVLQQGRSYADLADLLGMSEQAVRERAHRGLDRLADGGQLDAGQRGDVVDYLLGQQSTADGEATRTLLRSAAGANAWAAAVAAELRELRGADIPEIPETEAPAPAADAAAAEPDAEPAVRARPRPGRRDRPKRKPRPEGAEPAAAVATPAAVDTDAETVAPQPPSSRLGGALLLGGVAILLVAVVVWLVTRGDDAGTQSAASSPTPAAQSPSATPTPQQLGGLQLTAPSGGEAKGMMTLFATSNGQLAFTLEGTGLPANTKGDAYAVWLVGGDQPHRLGFAAAVKADGKLGVSGPRQTDQAQFPKWFTQAKSVVVSRETQEQSTKPGPVVLQGKIPTQAKAGGSGASGGAGGP